MLSSSYRSVSVSALRLGDSLIVAFGATKVDVLSRHKDSTETARERHIQTPSISSAHAGAGCPAVPQNKKLRSVQMVLVNHGEMGIDAGAACNDQAGKLARVRLAGELFNGRCRTGESVKVSEIAAKYQLNEDSVLNVLKEFQTLGMVTLSGNASAVFHSPNPKEMQEAYEIRAALEEIGGRAAARALKGNTRALQRELDAMVSDRQGAAVHWRLQELR